MRHYDAGRHEVIWNGGDDAGRQLASGIYFCCLKAGGFPENETIVLLQWSASFSDFFDPAAKPSEVWRPASLVEAVWSRSAPGCRFWRWALSAFAP
ncbi:MAG: hypothetical protein IPK20_00220 [Betaproteobacteria bacterium]|nr:hypothetical protein [Betaproteobacteria bacterium]